MIYLIMLTKCRGNFNLHPAYQCNFKAKLACKHIVALNSYLCMLCARMLSHVKIKNLHAILSIQV